MMVRRLDGSLMHNELPWPDLRWYKLDKANLFRYDLHGCDLSWADFREADLRCCDLSGCNLYSADFTRADLRGACLRESYLVGAQFVNAYLSGADLTRATLIDDGNPWEGPTSIRTKKSGEEGLLDPDTVGTLLLEAAWSESHGAVGQHLGVGLLYYTIPYIYQAKLCVCIGSGGGFVPRLMRQAQTDLQLNSKTYLVDANHEVAKDWGKPDWIDGSHFTTNWDVERIIAYSAEAVHRPEFDDVIDYLHIDGDHTYEVCKQDFELWGPKARIITMHDSCSVTEGVGVSQVISEIQETGQWNTLTLPFGAGTTILKRR